MRQRTKQQIAVAAITALALHFLAFMIAALPLKAIAASGETGFLVVAADRGFLGNQEIESVMRAFEVRYNASLAFIGPERQGVEDGYRTYIEGAIKTLRRRGAKRIVAIPLFVSEAQALLAQYRRVIERMADPLPLSWAPAMAESYLTAQILLDRVASLSRQPEQERLVILGAGAVNDADARRIKEDLEKLARDVTLRLRFKEVSYHVYYDRSAPEHEARNEQVDNDIIRTAAKRGRTLLVPFVIGPKFDQRMSMAGWLRRKFAEYDITLGNTVMPHDDVLTWLRASANRHLHPAPERIGVLIMPHGSSQPYNDGLERVIAPLRKQFRIEMAPGMGDPLILGEAIRRLEDQGITHIVFVRMYALKDHMKTRTDYILGLSEKPPRQGHAPPPQRIRSSAVFATFGGYEESPLIAEILRERILAISKSPSRETVILLAHGRMEDENDRRWREVMENNIRLIKAKLPRPFRNIIAMTLREDWPDKREEALHKIRQVIEQGNEDNGEVLIISNRLYGSGPYPRLLEGLEFTLNGQGLVPHPHITRWLEEGIRTALYEFSTDR